MPVSISVNINFDLLDFVCSTDLWYDIDDFWADNIHEYGSFMYRIYSPEQILFHLLVKHEHEIITLHDIINSVYSTSAVFVLCLFKYKILLRIFFIYF